MSLTRVLCVLLLIVLGRPAFGEMGVASLCPLPSFSASVKVSGSGQAPYPQPVTFNLMAFGVDPQRVDARVMAGAIDITVTGAGTGTSQIGACGSIAVNPVAPGTYVVSLYAVRDSQPAVRLAQRSIDIGGVASPATPNQPEEPPTPAAPRDEFATTQAVGEIGFQHSVSLDGAAQVSIPIFTPPGRQGVQPSLALAYSSRGGNGPLGVGWSLAGLSVITSCRRSPALDEAYGGTHPDRLCLDGARLIEKVAPPIGAAAAEYRTETDSYRKVIGRWGSGVPAPAARTYPDSFEVYAPDGTILKYAARPTSNAVVGGEVQACWWGKVETVWTGGAFERTFKDKHGGCRPIESQRRAWMLDTVEDRFGNRMEIDYDRAEPLLPIEIRYTYHAFAPATKAIKFVYEPRTDIRQATLDGVAYRAANRLKTIDVVAPLGLSEPPSTQGVLRRYELTYDMHPLTAQSMLTQVKTCAGDTADAACLSPLRFCYSPLRFCYSGSGPATYADKTLPVSKPSWPTIIPGYDGFRTADVNGDGFDDVVYRKPGLIAEWSYRLSDGNTLGAERTMGLGALPDDGELGVSLVDLDRNQTVDALVPRAGATYSLARGNIGGAFQTSALPGTLFTTGPNATPSRVVAVADFNGDTLPDLAVHHNCRGVSPRTVTSDSVYTACRWGVALNNSTSFLLDFTDATDFRWSADPCTEPQTTHPSGTTAAIGGYSNCAEAQPGDPAFVLDVDRNGENEMIVPIRRGPTEEFFRRLDYSTELRALGFPITSPSSLRGTGLSSRRMPRLFLDVNGDGLPDAAEIDGGLLSIAMNLGGTFDAPQTVSVSTTVGAALSQPNELRVGDFNDDGLEDIYLVSSRTVLQSNGQLGFVERTLPIAAGEDSCPPLVCPGYARRKWDQLLDFNGDGLSRRPLARQGRPVSPTVPLAVSAPFSRSFTRHGQRISP